MQLVIIVSQKVIHHIIFITACAQNILQHERKWWTLTPLANSSVTSTLPRVAHLLLMHHFSSLMYGLKMNTTNVKQVTDFQ